MTCKEGGQPRLITDLRAFVKCFPELEKRATLPPTGWGKYTPPGGTKPRWAEGTMEGHTRLSSEQRARFGCDRGAVDTKRERDAWRWSTPRDAAALESATSAGRLVTLGRQMQKGGDDRPPVTGKWCRDHSLDLMANRLFLIARSGDRWGWWLAGQPIHLLAPEAIWLQAAPACLHCHKLTYLSSLCSS